jgi:plasmid maintenance system killer protein
MEIASFRHKGLERFWRNDDVRGLPAKQVEKLRAMLTAIEEAENIAEMQRYSGWRTG